MAPVSNAKSSKAPFVKVTPIKKINYASFKASNLTNVISIKKTGRAPFKAFNLMNLIPIKKTSHASSEAFGIKNNTPVKITQPIPATSKATPAKAKRAAAAYLKEVNQIIKGIASKILPIFIIYHHIINLYFKMLIPLFYLTSYYMAS